MPQEGMQVTKVTGTPSHLQDTLFAAAECGGGADLDKGETMDQRNDVVVEHRAPNWLVGLTVLALLA